MDDPRMAALDEYMDLTAHADAGDEAALEELERLHQDEQHIQQMAQEIRQVRAQQTSDGLQPIGGTS